MHDKIMDSGDLLRLFPYPILETPRRQFEIRLPEIKTEPIDKDNEPNNLASNGSHTSPGAGPIFNDMNLINRALSVRPTTGSSNCLTPPDSASDRGTPESEQNDASENEEGKDHIRCLIQMAVDQNLSKNVENKMEVNESNEVCDKNSNVPKPKTGNKKPVRCKYCNVLFATKPDLWDHCRVHIPKEKQLECTYPGCKFVTDLKHHIEYHFRQHAGTKPLQCDKCDYRCATKSMLVSHKKSHSNIYQYSCKDCTYATKYCHSIKKHCINTKHFPNAVLDEQGRPVPEIVIDLYGKRRGPRIKRVSDTRRERLAVSTHQLNVMEEPQIAEPWVPPPIPAHLLMARYFPLFLPALLSGSPALMDARPQEEVLDLSRNGVAFSQEGRENEEMRESPSPARSSEFIDDGSSEKESCTTMFSNVEAVVQDPESPQKERSIFSNDNKCQYCDMTFGNNALYHMHMSYHGSPNPFTCNMCKQECSNSITFNVHIARIAH